MNSSERSKLDSKAVYVSGLPWEATEQDIIRYFGQIAPVVRVSIIQQRRPGKEGSSGKAVVEYLSASLAANAINLLNGSEISGRKIRVREDRKPDNDRSQSSKLKEDSSDNSIDVQTSHAVVAAGTKNESQLKKQSASDGASREIELYKVFVGSIAWETTKDHLLQLFSKIGKVIHVEILTTKRGRSLGSGIVEFADVESVTSAIEGLNDTEFLGRTIIVRHCYRV
jgi:RNA recognition motif-containing protein